MIIKEVLRDIQSFADDESEVVVENDGNFLFKRQDKDILFRLIEDNDTGALLVDYNGERKTYKSFLANDVARLDVFANKLIEKRTTTKGFINSNAVLKSLAKELTDKSLTLVNTTCVDKVYSTKITFITADAGHGKTALLKEFQHIQAKNYLSRQSNFLFWHVDLQGRELVRLNEAIMYDLGELRISGLGLYFASIMTLVRRGLVVLAIDGFDELAAEIGGSVALGSLSYLVSQLENKGVVVAASRRTFFNTQDYVKRNSMLKNAVSAECEFHEIKLENWTKDDALEYISHNSKNPEVLYQNILIELQGNPEHPILTRPFLLTKIVDILSEDSSIEASTLMKGMTNPTEGVAVVVEAFTRREVNKWKLRDTETGKPYLEFEQHLVLLEMIAEEMWLSQKDHITLEEIEYFSTSLCEDLRIEQRFRQRIVSMATSHALLVPSEIDADNRKFEHEEFKNYFIARALANLLKEGNSKDLHNKVKRFLYVAQLSDSVAQYACSFINKDEKTILQILSQLNSLIKDEWKPTYLQLNLGTLIPFLINGVTHNTAIEIKEKINYSSLAFENKKITNTVFENGTFINISFRNTKLDNVIFNNCAFNELRIYPKSDNSFTNVKFNNCSINNIAEYGEDGYVISSYYNPEKIQTQLLSYSIILDEKEISDSITKPVIEISEFKKAILKFLNFYRRTTIQYESNIISDVSQYKSIKGVLLKEVIPFLEKKNIIEQKDKTKNSKQVLYRAWSLTLDLDELLKQDGSNDNSELAKFWEEINKK